MTGVITVVATAVIKDYPKGGLIKHIGKPDNSIGREPIYDNYKIKHKIWRQ